MGSIRSFFWAILAPIRWYVRSFPIARGKGLLMRTLIVPLLPDSGGFTVAVPGGGQVKLLYRETLGLSTLVYGPFEQEELRYLCARLEEGDTAVDVGANVGLYSVAFAKAVQPSGRVLAVEPLPANVERLSENLGMNRLANVTVHACAVSDRGGTVPLLLADDPAYASTDEVSEARGTGSAIAVPAMTLDQIWEQEGRPQVRVMKLDIEGGELKALRGAHGLLEHCHPLLLVEAHGRQRIDELSSLLAPLGYAALRPPGFKPWNHIYEYRQ